MFKVPGFLLKKIYIRGSLRNDDEGFQFQLKNSLGSGHTCKLLPLTLDGVELPQEDSFFSVEAASVCFNAVSPARPIALTKDTPTTVQVKGRTLAQGPHKVGMGLDLEGIGEVWLSVEDVVQEA